MTQATALSEVHASDPSSERWTQMHKLACEFTVDIFFPNFRISDVLGLRRKTIVNSQWRVGKDVPLRVNGRVIAHGEFEVVGDRLAVRLTELA